MINILYLTLFSFVYRECGVAIVTVFIIILFKGGTAKYDVRKLNVTAK